MPVSLHAASNSRSRCKWRRTHNTRVPRTPVPVRTSVEAGRGCCIPLRRRRGCVRSSSSTFSDPTTSSEMRSEDPYASTLSEELGQARGWRFRPDRYLPQELVCPRKGVTPRAAPSGGRTPVALQMAVITNRAERHQRVFSHVDCRCCATLCDVRQSSTLE